MNNNNKNNHNGNGTAAAAAEPPPGPTARTVSPAVACLPQASASASVSESQPLWSADPAVNAMVILLLQKGLKPNDSSTMNCSTNNDQQANNTLPSLLETLKERLQQEQKTLAMFTDDRTQSRSNKSNPLRHMQDSQATSMKTMVTQSDSRIPAVSDSQSSSKQSETGSSQAESQSQPQSFSFSLTPPASSNSNCSTRQAPHRRTTSTYEDSNNGKPTRRELLEALQQHMDILERRGQVSSVIPGFLKRPRDAQVKRPRDQDNQDHRNNNSKEEDQVSTSSTKAVQRGRKRQKQCTSKFQYYEDLATELLSNVIVPIPETIYVPIGSHEDDDSMDTLTEGDATEFTGDSIDLESFCSTASSVRKPTHQRPSTAKNTPGPKQL